MDSTIIGKKKMENRFNIAYLDTDALCITKPDGAPFPPEEQSALLAELNSLFPEHIKFSNDGYAPAMVVIKTKNRFYLNEKGDLKVKGSALKSSKTLPSIKKFHRRCMDALLGLSGTTVAEIYREEVIALARGVNSISDWSSKKTISEKTIASKRKTEQDIMDAVRGRHWQNGDKIWVYRTNENKLKLVEDYDPSNPDYALPKLLSSLANASKVFDTVVDNSYRVDFGKVTNARKLNNLVRDRVMPEKKKKPTPKNVLQELLDLISKRELQFPDNYAEERFTELVQDAEVVLTPKPKVSRKKRNE